MSSKNEIEMRLEQNEADIAKLQEEQQRLVDQLKVLEKPPIRSGDIVKVSGICFIWIQDERTKELELVSVDSQEIFHASKEAKDRYLANDVDYIVGNIFDIINKGF